MKLLSKLVILASVFLALSAHAGNFRVLGSCDLFQKGPKGTDAYQLSVQIYMDNNSKLFYADVYNVANAKYEVYRLRVDPNLQLTLSGDKVMIFKSLSSKNPISLTVYKDASGGISGDLSVQTNDASIDVRALQCDEEML